MDTTLCKILKLQAAMNGPSQSTHVRLRLRREHAHLLFACDAVVYDVEKTGSECYVKRMMFY